MTDLAIGSEFAGHRIESVAGRGGMGVVYVATHLALDRRVALKLITPQYAQDPEFRERFKRESKIAAQVNHPNVIPIFHAGEEDGLLYITMYYVEGTDLKEMIQGGGAVDAAVAADLVAQVGAALDAAHARGLVHRDIKPANVVIERDGERLRAYLTDFGLTKQAASQSGLTGTGMFVGTLDYIAPEQLQGHSVDGRADVYALGCVLYQALTGEVPYPRDSEPAKIWAHMGEPPPSISRVAPGVPAEFEQVVQRAMAKSPDDRYPSAGDLGRAALAAAARQGVSQPERSVAVGDAAPPQATEAQQQPPAPPQQPTAPQQPPAEPPPPQQPPVSQPAAQPSWPPGSQPGAGRRSRTPLIVAGAVVAVAAVAGVLALVLAGGGNEYDPVQAEDDAARFVEDENDDASVDRVKCDKDVELKEGAQFDCEADLENGQTVAVEGEVKGDANEFSFDVDKDELAQAVAGGGSDGGDVPAELESTIRDFQTAVIDNNASGACVELSDPALEREFGGYTECLDKFESQAPAGSSTGADLVIEDVTVNGDKATARVRNPGTGVTSTIKLVDEGGSTGWAIDQL